MPKVRAAPTAAPRNASFVRQDDAPSIDADDDSGLVPMADLLIGTTATLLLVVLALAPQLGTVVRSPATPPYAAPEITLPDAADAPLLLAADRQMKGFGDQAGDELGVPTIVLLDLSANVLVVVVVLLVVAMMRPVTPFERDPVVVPIFAEAPTGAVALVDALFGRTRTGGPRLAVDLTEAGVRTQDANGAVHLTPRTANFRAALAAALGKQKAAVD